ncbi:hypothetical protein D9758_008254 [Tetrapyrgos nigripes]|uniref:Uncharacterized protein n=1 Tax=Tetrapyrgos nigripes TaxID=182062 RepID=A0A8H5G1J0_9AGAR|nr:hypothetical protein D9758_008254 [Tetrapyrgos nigripes]
MRPSLSSLSWTGFAAVLWGCETSMAVVEPVNAIAKGHLARQFDPSLPLTISDLPTSTDSAPSTGETPFLAFTTSNAHFTTCNSAQINWDFSGPVEDVTFALTNINVTQANPPSSTAGPSGPGTLTNDLARRGFPGLPTGVAITTVFDIPPDSTQQNPPPYLLETLSIAITPTDQSYLWNKVNVPQGWYKIIATASDPQTQEYEDFVATSLDFFVSNGSDTSCLITTGSGDSSPTQTTDSNPSPSSTGDTAPTSPIGASQSSSSTNTGAIAGGIIGGIVALAVLIAGLVICHRKRRQGSGPSTKGAPETGNYPEGRGVEGEGGGSRGLLGGILPVGKWGKLGSFDASTVPAERMSGSGGADVVAAAVGTNNTRPGTGHSTSSGGGRKRSLSHTNSTVSTRSGFGGLGLAALGFATSQKKGGKQQNPYTAAAKRDRRKTQESLNSVGPMLASFTSSTGYHTSSKNAAEDEDGFGMYSNTSPGSYDKEKAIPLSPLHSPGSSVDHNARSPFSDSGHIDENLVTIASGSTPSTTYSTPSTSRTNSRRSMARTPAPAGEYSSSSSSVNVNANPNPNADVTVNPSNRSDRSTSTRSRSQSTPMAPPRKSPHRMTPSTSSSSASSPVTPSLPHYHRSSSSNQEKYGARRASSPDYTQVVQKGYSRGSGSGAGGQALRSPGGVNPPTLPSSSPPPTEGGLGSTSKKKASRKPVPSYNPDDPLFVSYSPTMSPTTSPKAPHPALHSPQQSYAGLAQSHGHMPSTSVSHNDGNSPKLFSVPMPSNNSSSSIVAHRRLAPPVPGHGLEHKDSATSLKSLRELGGGGKPMHVLIPDMPIDQQQHQGR